MQQAILFVPRDIGALEAALEGLAALDAYLINKYKLPPLLELDVRYGIEKQELWKNALQLAEGGVFDCEDLAGYRVGELRVRLGEPARIILKRTGPSTLHAQVLREDGRIEDPSIWFGMKRPQERNAYA